jgi:hypothetical protein
MSGVWGEEGVLFIEGGGGGGGGIHGSEKMENKLKLLFRLS